MSPDLPFKENPLERVLHASVFWLYALGMIFGIVLLSQSVFWVGSQEIGLIWRFGKLQSIAEPGTHFCWPYPVESTQKIPYHKSMEVTITTLTPEKPLSSPNETAETLNPERDGYLLTADGAILTLPMCSLTYSIDGGDPAALVRLLTAYPDEKDFLGAVREAGHVPILRRLLEQAAIRATAEMKAENILRQPADFNDRILTFVREGVGRLHLGILCEKISANLFIPGQVSEAYETVGMIRSTEQKMLSDAAKKAVSLRSEGILLAGKIRSDAHSARAARLAQAKGDADRFNRILPEYRRHPETVRRILRDETAEKIYADAEEKIILDPLSIGQLRLNITRERPVQPKESEE